MNLEHPEVGPAAVPSTEQEGKLFTRLPTKPDITETVLQALIIAEG